VSERNASWTIRNVSSRALSTWFASGIPATGFVATVQQTSTLSRASSSMIRTNPGPDESGSRLSGTPHALAIALR